MNEPLVYMKISDVNGEKIVAICDEDLLGRVIIDRRLNIVFHVSKHFYGGELVPVSYAMSKAKEATILNLLGENTINAAVKEGLIHPDAVIRIAGIPHAQLVHVKID